MQHLSAGKRAFLSGTIFSALTAYVAMAAIGEIPGMDVPPAWHIVGTVMALCISAPVCAQFVKQRAKIERLHSELAAAYRMLEQRANIDSLTGLSNRAAFLSDIEPSRPGWILVCDLDEFKQINDNHGHAVGDQVLVLVGAAIRKSVRSADRCGRLGGEEFSVFLPGADQAAAREIAERIRAAVAKIYVPTAFGPPVRPTISIGVAQSADRDIDRAFRTADACMYRAKNAGRDRVVFASA